MTRPKPKLTPQLLEAFNVYRTQVLEDVLDQPRTFAFVDGVVIDSAARVIAADPGGVVLKVDRVQLNALARSPSLVVESPLHGASFRADVEAVDARRGYVSLSGFEAFVAHRERRGRDRVAPGVAMLVKVFGRGHEADGRVVDLSPTTVAADFERAGFARVAKAPVVRLELLGEDSKRVVLRDFITTARIHRTDNRDETGTPACRVVLELDAFPALDRTLRRYVARRQREILTQLRLPRELEPT